jgi:hypothetical protein
LKVIRSGFYQAILLILYFFLKNRNCEDQAKEEEENHQQNSNSYIPLSRKPAKRRCRNGGHRAKEEGESHQGGRNEEEYSTNGSDTATGGDNTVSTLLDDKENTGQVALDHHLHKRQRKESAARNFQAHSASRHPNSRKESAVRDLQAHTTSRRPKLSANSGSSVKNIHISNARTSH